MAGFENHNPSQMVNYRTNGTRQNYEATPSTINVFKLSMNYVDIYEDDIIDNLGLNLSSLSLLTFANITFV